MTLSAEEESVLKRHTKAICHLNYAVNASQSSRKQRQLGFILGAGVSNDLKIPGWERLLDAIEGELNYKSSGRNGPQSYRGEQLFQYFRKCELAKLTAPEREVREACVNTGWRQVVARHLYSHYIKDGKEDLAGFKDAIGRHSYINEIAKIAIDLELVITHNFDNALEVAVSTTESQRPLNRRFNSFWKPDPFLRPDMLNIYHPNGYTPTAGFKGSDSIVLTEANFADHLANTNNAEAHFLLGHLSNKTWLIVGHSLADGTLKNALRLHASRRPGHISYFVHWLETGENELSPQQRDAIREANLSTYNLYTFFLNSKEIGALLRLIKMDPSELKGELTFRALQHRFVYYICGPVSSGKSTILSHLRSVATVEEWPDPMPPAMYKYSIDATAGEKIEIDDKLAMAIFKKNEEVEETKVGIVAVDRAPLDFIAFPDQKDEKPSQTAKNRYQKVLKPFVETNFANLCSGQVIVIQAEPVTLVQRQIQRGRYSDPGEARAVLERQQEIMRQVYEPAINNGSKAEGDCCTIAECVQDVIRIIFFEEYQLFDFKGRLDHFLTDGGT